MNKILLLEITVLNHKICVVAFFNTITHVAPNKSKVWQTMDKVIAMHAMWHFASLMTQKYVNFIVNTCILVRTTSSIGRKMGKVKNILIISASTKLATRQIEARPVSLWKEQTLFPYSEFRKTEVPHLLMVKRVVYSVTERWYKVGLPQQTVTLLYQKLCLQQKEHTITPLYQKLSMQQKEDISHKTQSTVNSHFLIKCPCTGNSMFYL